MSRQLFWCNGLPNKNRLLPSSGRPLPPNSTLGQNGLLEEIVDDIPLLFRRLRGMVGFFPMSVPRKGGLFKRFVNRIKNKGGSLEQVVSGLVDRGPFERQTNGSVLFAKDFNNLGIQKSGKSNIIEQNCVDRGT